METSLEYQQLRAAVSNVVLPIGERRDAAQLVITLKLSAVLAVPDDDSEVGELLKPWTDRTLAQLFAGAPGVDGWPLLEARAIVLKRRKRRVLKDIAADGTEDEMIRETARRLLSPASSAARVSVTSNR